MICPLHRLPVLSGQGDKCEACERIGLEVIQCEIDKIGRTLDTMNEHGRETDFRQSHAVLVFTRKASEPPAPEAIDSETVAWLNKVNRG